jgi:hypothetical protein
MSAKSCVTALRARRPSRLLPGLAPWARWCWALWRTFKFRLGAAGRLGHGIEGGGGQIAGGRPPGSGLGPAPGRRPRWQAAAEATEATGAVSSGLRPRSTASELAG